MLLAAGEHAGFRFAASVASGAAAALVGCSPLAPQVLVPPAPPATPVAREHHDSAATQEQLAPPSAEAMVQLAREYFAAVRSGSAQALEATITRDAELETRSGQGSVTTIWKQRSSESALAALAIPTELEVIPPRPSGGTWLGSPAPTAVHPDAWVIHAHVPDAEVLLGSGAEHYLFIEQSEQELLIGYVLESQYPLTFQP